MEHTLVIVGSAGHVGYVLSDLPRFPQVRFGAYAPSFAGEDVSRYGKTAGVPAAQTPSAAQTPVGYDDWREMLDRERPEIVVVAGRYDQNAPISLEALRRGCHVISEKPAAFTLEEVGAVREEIARQGALYTMMLAIRYQLPYYTARGLVAEGVIGEPVLITGQKSYRWGASRPTWYADPAAYGSTMGWVGIHAFDFCGWIAGAAFTEVYAHHANLVHTERPGCQDVATVIARLSNGGSATFTMDFLRPEAAATHGDDRARIVGSRGVLEVRDEGRRLHVITPERDEPNWPLVDHGRTFFGDFVGALEGTGELLITAEESLRVTEFALQAARAADEHRVIAL